MPATISGTTGGIGLIGSGTAQNSTSGTAIDFTDIPAGVKRITVIFRGVSTTGTSPVVIQIGSGSVDATGYLSGNVGNTNINATAGFGVTAVSATTTFHGAVCLLSFGSNIWVSSGAIGYSDAAGGSAGGGSKTLSGTLDRIRITTVNGTDTFDAGSVNILYE